MPRLNVEHFACNVSDPVAMAAWYVEHLGMRVVRRVDSPHHIHFIADANGRVVNRCEGIAFTGGCTDTNEFNYLVVKTMRSLGVVYVENQARV